MTSVANLYLSGFSKPLGEWSERALSQVREDVVQLLGVESNAQARVDLSETLTVLDAETTRRERQLRPEEVEALRAKGALQPFNEREGAKKPLLARAREAIVVAFSRDAGREPRGEEAGHGLER